MIQSNVSRAITIRQGKYTRALDGESVRDFDRFDDTQPFVAADVRMRLRWGLITGRELCRRNLGDSIDELHTLPFHVRHLLVEVQPRSRKTPWEDIRGFHFWATL